MDGEHSGESRPRLERTHLTWVPVIEVLAFAAGPRNAQELIGRKVRTRSTLHDVPVHPEPKRDTFPDRIFRPTLDEPYTAPQTEPAAPLASMDVALQSDGFVADITPDYVMVAFRRDPLRPLIDLPALMRDAHVIVRVGYTSFRMDFLIERSP